MVYKIQKIESKEEISLCKEFRVDNSLWTCKKAPKTVGRMGYIEGKGLFIQMTCYEQNPLRRYKEDMSPVCRDSAMEAFFAFPHKDKDNKENFTPYNDCMYMNFEMNANGAMYAKYGWGRKGRTALLQQEIKNCACQATINDGYWTVSFILNNDLIKKVYKIQDIEELDGFWCNFYKISEDETIEHYMAFSPIENETPNFHLPQFFAKAVLI